MMKALQRMDLSLNAWCYGYWPGISGPTKFVLERRCQCHFEYAWPECVHEFSRGSLGVEPLLQGKGGDRLWGPLQTGEAMNLV